MALPSIEGTTGRQGASYATPANRIRTSPAYAAAAGPFRNLIHPAGHASTFLGIMGERIMADKTLISWTDATWNIITGCSRVSAGCEHCFAERLAGTRMKHHPSREGLTRETQHGPVWTGQVRFNDRWWWEPLNWRKPRRIFVVAHGDLFHENVPERRLNEVFAMMMLAPWHTYQVLTKRSSRMRYYVNRMESDNVGYEDVTDAAERTGIGQSGLDLREHALAHSADPLRRQRGKPGR